MQGASVTGLLAWVESIDGSYRRVTAILPDEVLWQGGIHMPEDLLEVYCDQSHHHELPCLWRCHDILHTASSVHKLPTVSNIC